MTSLTRWIRIVPGERRYTVRQHKDSVLAWVLNFGRLMEAAETLSTKTLSGTNVTVDSSSLSGQELTLTLSSATRDGYVDITVTTSASETIAIRLHVNVEDPSTSIW